MWQLCAPIAWWTGRAASRISLQKQPFDVEAWFARLDELGARDFLPDGIPDDPPLEPDPRVFFDE